MAGMIEPQDFAEYLNATEFKAKVRAASDFAEDLEELAFPRRDVPADPDMGSTKLRGVMRFRPGEVTAWAGYNGHKKSMFTTQVALDMCALQQRTLIASLEMQPERTLLRMSRQAYGHNEMSRSYLADFSRWTDGRLWLFDHVGRISPATCIAALRYFADKLQGRQVFVDSLMMVCASEEHLDEQKQLVTDLVRVAQETGLHVHLICHCRKPQSGEDKPPSKYDLRGSAAISDQCHNVITVWADKAKKPDDYDRPDALVTVEKQRNGEFEGRCALWWHAPSMRFVDKLGAHVEPYPIKRFTGVESHAA
jgi:twinkle protein